MVDRDQRIQEIAYMLWEQEGCPQGQSDRFWHLAIVQYEAEVTPAVEAPNEEPSAQEPPVLKAAVEPPVVKAAKEEAPAVKAQPTTVEVKEPAAKPKAAKPKAVKAKAEKPKTEEPKVAVAPIAKVPEKAAAKPRASAAKRK